MVAPERAPDLVLPLLDDDAGSFQRAMNRICFVVITSYNSGAPQQISEGPDKARGSQASCQ